MKKKNEQTKKQFAPETTLANWRTHPNSKWAFHHVSEIVPSAEIVNDPNNIWQLNQKKIDIENRTLKKVLDKSSTDAVVVIHNKNIVFESYYNGMKETDRHILFSVSKSLLGLVAGCLIKDKVIKETDLITHYLPELNNTAYRGATIRDALDMQVGVFFNEDYEETDSTMMDYRYAANWNPTPPHKIGLNLKSFLGSLKQKHTSHSRIFNYASPNADMLAWLFEKASGKRYCDLISDYIWKQIGSQRPAYITVDRTGNMRAAGGICATAKDLALIGMLICEKGTRDHHQIVPPEWIEDIFFNGSQDAWKKGTFKDFFTDKEMHYRSQWYNSLDNGHLLFGFGIHGQYIFIDTQQKLSIAWLSSEKDPLNKKFTSNVLAAINETRKIIAKN